jgi:SAM-dependent methyltransferase
VTYSGSAELYDLVYSFKDYADEAAWLVSLVAERAPDAQTLLDVGCGTGRHLQRLRARFDCEGVDLDPGLLAAARERLPGVPLHEADMRTLDLGRTFDVVTCLFSAIGYMLDLDQLGQATAAMAKHVAPGGLLLVEPWITPDVWQAGRPHALAAEQDGLAVTRMSRSGVDGRVSWVEMEYLVSDGTTLEQFSERHEMGLFTSDEMRAALEATGLRAEHDPAGLIGRGLWIGTRESA